MNLINSRLYGMYEVNLRDKTLCINWIL